MRRAAVVAALLATIVAGTAATAAHAAAPKADFYDVQNALMCDTCNVALKIADSERADQERAEIRELISQGLTKDQILDRFVDEYGPNVLAEPRGGGASVTVWLVPLLVLVAVVAVLLVMLPRWRRARAAERASADDVRAEELSTEDAERLDRDLALYE